MRYKVQISGYIFVDSDSATHAEDAVFEQMGYPDGVEVMPEFALQ